MIKHFRYFSLSLLSFISLSCFGSEVARASSSKSVAAHSFSERVDAQALLRIILDSAQDNKAIGDVATDLIIPVYESPQGSFKTTVHGVHFGNAFNIHPEVLADTMNLARKKRVLEIGAASGENALLLGCAGAHEVYINDINEDELKRCRASLERLPEDIQRRFTIVKGDCLEVFDAPSFAGRFDVIYVRNLFHFFLGDKRKKFIEMVGRLLSPRGRLILTTNSALLSPYKEAMERTPDAYVFRKTEPYLIHGDICRSLARFGDVIVEKDLEKVTSTSAHFIPALEYTGDDLTFTEGFDSITPATQKVVLESTKKLIPLLAPHGGFRIDNYVSHAIAYTRRTIAQAFAESGLTLRHGLSIDQKGHVTENLNEEAWLTAIFEKPLKDDPMSTS